jgi:hypothetical protein
VFLVLLPALRRIRSPITSHQSPVNQVGNSLPFSGKTISGVGFELYQNQPNPFVNKTSIGFFLARSSGSNACRFLTKRAGWFTSRKASLPKGENTIVLDRALLNTTGSAVLQTGNGYGQRHEEDDSGAVILIGHFLANLVGLKRPTRFCRFLHHIP